MAIKGEALIYARDHHTCAYCGYDGREFEAYMQLQLDHILPKHCNGTDVHENLVTSCGACNKLMGLMKFTADDSREHIIAKKREKVAEGRRGWYEHWLANVAPNYLKRPLSAIPPLP